MASGSLGSLVVSLAVDTAKFQGDLGKAAAVAERRMKNIRDTASRAFTALTIAATAAGVALTAALGKSLKNADSLLEMSQALGTTVENLSALTYASGLAGVSQEELAVAIKKLASTAVDASNGVAASAGAFKALGIEVSRTDGSLKSVDELIGEIADAFSKAPDSITKTALATDLFGKSGAKLIPLLNEGSDGIDAMKARAEELGLVISTKTALAADQFFDNLTDLKSIGTGFSNLLAEELAPNLAAITGHLTNAAGGASQFSESVKTVATFIRVLASGLVVVGALLNNIGKTLAATSASFAAFLSGDFEKSAEIMRLRTLDALKEGENFRAAWAAIWEDAAAESAASAETLGPELAAPAIEAAKQSKAALEEMERFMTQGVWGRTQEIRLESPLGPTMEENAAAVAASLREINSENIELSERTIKIGAAFEEADESAKGLMATIKDEVARQTFTTIRDLIYDFSKGADNFGKHMLDAIRMILANKATEQLFELFGSLGKGGGGGGFLSALASGIGSLFGGGGSKSGSFKGFAAHGMTLRPGEFAIAGEAGPEPVFGGSSGAQIVPFAKGAAQRSVHIQAPLSISVRVDGSTDRSITQQQIDRTVRGAIGEYNEFWRDQLSRGAYA